MSDTVLVALITFASGAVGACVGAWAVIKSSEKTTKGQLQQALVQEIFRSRASAYQEVFERQIDMVHDQYSPDSVSAFGKAINSACLVASPKTALCLMQLRTAENVRDKEKCQKLLAAMLASMQEDLSCFSEPKIRENLW